MNPELRKWFIDSIDCLRKIGFFEDYSDLISDEILKIRRVSVKLVYS